MYEDILVRAINSAGLQSQRSNVVERQRLPFPPRRHLLAKELERVIESTNEYVDSLAYFFGCYQRFPRDVALEIIKNEIKRDDPAFLAQLMAKLEPPEIEAPEDDTTTAADEADTHELKKRQFLQAIRRWQARADDADEERRLCKERQLFVIPAVRRWQAKMSALEQELDRVLAFTGAAVDSSALHGTVQRFGTDDLIFDLGDKINEVASWIASAKSELILLRKRVTDRHVRIDLCESHVRDRVQAMHKYIKATGTGEFAIVSSMWRLLLLPTQPHPPLRCGRRDGREGIQTRLGKLHARRPARLTTAHTPAHPPPRTPGAT